MFKRKNPSLDDIVYYLFDGKECHNTKTCIYILYGLKDAFELDLPSLETASSRDTSMRLMIRYLKDAALNYQSKRFKRYRLTTEQMTLINIAISLVIGLPEGYTYPYVLLDQTYDPFWYVP